MRVFLLALVTALGWAYGISLMVTFSNAALAEKLDHAYPFVAIVLIIGLICYVVDALRNPTVPDEKRKLWAVVLGLGHFFAQPFYWWWYVRPRNT